MTLANPVGNLADWHDGHGRRNQEQLNDPTELGISRTISRADARQGCRQGAAGKRIDERYLMTTAKIVFS